ncbi:MAG: LytTR family DNA-binding domain-containing protein [Parerythrobacter sp.]
MTDPATPLRTLIVDDEPLAVERLRLVCERLAGITVIGSAADGETAIARSRDMRPDLVLLDITMPGRDGLSVARALAKHDPVPAIVFVTAHNDFAVEAFDLEAVDYVLKPVAMERLERAVARVTARRGTDAAGALGPYLAELWVPHRSELVRLDTGAITRIDAERDYVRLHTAERSYLLLQTITGLEKRLDPKAFIRIHRSTILQRDAIAGLRHDGLGAWSVDMADGENLRIGRTYLKQVKAMAGR